MKKLLIIGITMLGLSRGVFADATAVPIGSQVMLSLLSHVTAVEEQTSHGQMKSAFLDGVAQFGHYNGDYIAAIDAGAVNSLAPDAQGKIAGTVGVHVHVLSLLASKLQISPSLAALLKNLELNPRESWDADVKHGVFSVTFGAHIPFE